MDLTCLLFFLHRDEEGLEGLKEQQWELPLQDGRSLLCQAGGKGPEPRPSLMFPVYLPEPLYQTYRAAVLSEELWGVSEDGSPSPANPGEAPTFSRLPGPRNTLWQELPAVRASGLLESLSPQERRMQEVGTSGRD